MDATQLDKVIGTIRALKNMVETAKARPEEVRPGVMETTLLLEKWIDLLLVKPEDNIASFMTTATYILACNPELLQLHLVQLATYGPLIDSLISTYKEVR